MVSGQGHWPHYLPNLHYYWENNSDDTWQKQCNLGAVCDRSDSSFENKNYRNIELKELHFANAKVAGPVQNDVYRDTEYNIIHYVRLNKITANLHGAKDTIKYTCETLSKSV